MPDPAAPDQRRSRGRRRDVKRPDWRAIRRVLRLIFAPIVVVLAILYFLIDGIVLSLLRPVLRRLATWSPVARLTAWLSKLGPYPTLALVLVPIVILEPLKPVAFYLMAKRHVVVGTFILAGTEIVKIVAVERLFRLSHAKLMTIPTFARVYTFVAGWLSYLESLPPWQFVLRRVAWVNQRARRVIEALRS